MVTTGHIYVSPEGIASFLQAGAVSHAHAEGLRMATRAVHRESGLICAQLSHGGGRARAHGAYDGVCVSQIAHPKDPMEGEVLDDAGILRIIAAFGSAAALVCEAGFDAIEIHGAHGYLVSQFLSPTTNKRTDTWGGNLESRARFAHEVYRSIRAAVGSEFPVGIKLGCVDSDPAGLTVQDAIIVAQALAREGIDFVEVSGALHQDVVKRRIAPGEGEAYYREIAAAMKRALSIPVILVGGIRSLAVAEGLIADGVCEAVALSRPLIREPHLLSLWREGKASSCVSCNRCLIVKDEPTACRYSPKA
jgi:2,4-dienoyl-CoA reductase-like NADH-dependent reductase (Old Yellow Enzyme family)